MSDVWYKLTENTKKGDIILLGGDFVMACSECCFKQDECTSVAKKLNTSCCDTACNEQCNTCRDCLCKCLPTKWKEPSNDKDLLKLLIKKLQEGVIVIILDDLIFIDSVYKDNKPKHDYIISNLRLASNGNLFIYTIPTTNYVHVHSKILTYFYVNTESPYMVTSMGSFNPSFPNSLTLEIGLFVTGLMHNPLIQAIGSYMWTISNYIYNLKGPKNIGDDNPLKIISSHINTTMNYKKVIKTDINFCGKIFCSNTINQKKLQDRLTFQEKDVEFRLGGEPTTTSGGKNIFSNFFYGMDLIKNLFTNSKKHVKIGIMQSVVEQLPFCNNDSLCNTDYGFSPLLFNDELMKLIKDGKGLYVMQKKPKKANIDGTYGIMGGLWSWLYYNGNNCKMNENNICDKTPQQLGFYGRTAITSNPVSIRWFKSALHWKMYLSDNEIIQSTQHPTKLFYNKGAKTEVTMGYELSIKNCPKLISYYDNLYNYYWSFQTIIPSFDQFSSDILPCGTGKLNKSGCCDIEGGTTCVKSCYKGGKGPQPFYNISGDNCIKVSDHGKYYSLEECQKYLKPKPKPKSKSKVFNILLIIMLVMSIILLILLVIYLACKYLKKSSK
jgi:hypothetical protein